MNFSPLPQGHGSFRPTRPPIGATSSGSYGSLTLEEVLNDHVQGLGVPAWEGAMFGHVKKQWAVPVGFDVEVDAALGTIRMLEPAVRA